MVRKTVMTALMFAAIVGCQPKGVVMDADELTDFARRYTAAWCSQDPASVAAFFLPMGH